MLFRNINEAAMLAESLPDHSVRGVSVLDLVVTVRRATLCQNAACYGSYRCVNTHLEAAARGSLPLERCEKDPIGEQATNSGGLLAIQERTIAPAWIDVAPIPGARRSFHKAVDLPPTSPDYRLDLLVAVRHMFRRGGERVTLLLDEYAALPLAASTSESSANTARLWQGTRHFMAGQIGAERLLSLIHGASSAAQIKLGKSDWTFFSTLDILDKLIRLKGDTRFVNLYTSHPFLPDAKRGRCHRRKGSAENAAPQHRQTLHVLPGGIGTEPVDVEAIFAPQVARLTCSCPDSGKDAPGYRYHLPEFLPVQGDSAVPNPDWPCSERHVVLRIQTDPRTCLGE